MNVNRIIKFNEITMKKIYLFLLAVFLLTSVDTVAQVKDAPKVIINIRGISRLS